MPDKLTDKEIVKALECCMDEMGCIKGCPCFDPKAKGSHCTVSKKLELEKLTIDLINRLQAENERLKEEICIQHKIIDERGAEVLRHDRCIRTLHEKLETAKAEAYKEFAESIFNLFPADKNFTTISRFTVRQNLKELVGE